MATGRHISKILIISDLLILLAAGKAKLSKT